jgi:hypothetical protein
MRIRMTQARPTADDPREHRTLSTGEIYFVIGANDSDYRVVDDLGEPVLFPKALFQVLDRSIPTGWVLHDYEDSYYLDPAATAQPGFYEDWFGSSGDRAAELRAHETLRRSLVDMRTGVDAADQALIDRDLSRLDAAAARRT